MEELAIVVCSVNMGRNFLHSTMGILFLSIGCARKKTKTDVEYIGNENNPGWLVYVGDEILPNYKGIIIKPL